MGRKKSSQVQRSVAKVKVDTVFDCPFCNDIKTVEVIMDNNNAVADIKCRICLAKFQTEIHHLTEPIDVYWEWIDECEKVNKKSEVVEEHKSVDGEDEGDEEDVKPYVPIDKRKIKHDEQIIDDDDDEGDEEDEDDYPPPTKKSAKKEIFADEESD